MKQHHMGALRRLVKKKQTRDFPFTSTVLLLEYSRGQADACQLQRTRDTVQVME